MRKLSLTAIVLILFFAHTSFLNAPVYVNERNVEVKVTLKGQVSGHINALRVKMIIPASLKDRQFVEGLTFSIEPDSVYTVNANTYALFKLFDLEKDFKIVVKGKIKIFNVINAKAGADSVDFAKYLVPEPNIEVGSEKIIAVAQTLKQSTDIETAIKTFEYVKNHITYKRNNAIGAEKVLESGIGKCMDYSDLFVALLRANKIAAKSMFGIVVSESAPNPLHAWPEVYLKKQGWVRFDPTGGHSEIEPDGNNYKMKIKNKYVTLSEGRNDPELRTALYYYRYYCTAGSTFKMQHVVDISGD